VRLEWALDRIEEIMLASQEEALAIADPFTVDNPPTPRRTLDAASGTLAEVRETLCTLLGDMKRRGSNRGTG
jgi:hypothetical protein